jgi:hypothetical protein
MASTSASRRTQHQQLVARFRRGQCARASAPMKALLPDPNDDGEANGDAR